MATEKSNGIPRHRSSFAYNRQPHDLRLAFAALIDDLRPKPIKASSCWSCRLHTGSGLVYGPLSLGMSWRIGLFSGCIGDAARAVGLAPAYLDTKDWRRLAALIAGLGFRQRTVDGIRVWLRVLVPAQAKQTELAL